MDIKIISLLDCFKVKESTSIMDRILRKLVNPMQRLYIKKLPLQKMRCNCVEKRMDCIASLTTFPERIYDVSLAVKSLLNQTLPPREVVLWLSEEQFPDHRLPDCITELIPYGLVIRYCKNLLAHKKYYYALQEYTDDCVITFDDDLIYREDTIERLISMRDQYPDCILCSRGRAIVIKNKKVTEYKKWKLNELVYCKRPSYLFMASTGAGTLYPPRVMPKETFDEERMRELAWTADDLWMKVMSVLGRVRVVWVGGKQKPLCLINGRQKTTLAKENVDQNKNDEVMMRLMGHYPEVLNLLCEEAACGEVGL